MKKMFGYARVNRVSGVRKDYDTVGLNLTKENAVSLAQAILKMSAGKKTNSDKVVLTIFKNRVNDEGMRTLVTAY